MNILSSYGQKPLEYIVSYRRTHCILTLRLAAGFGKNLRKGILGSAGDLGEWMKSMLDWRIQNTAQEDAFADWLEQLDRSHLHAPTL